MITHAASLDLSNVYLHSLSRNWIIPLTIVTVMSALSIAQLKHVGAKPIALFGLGSLVIATLPVLLVMIASKFSDSAHALFLEREYWRGLVPYRWKLDWRKHKPAGIARAHPYVLNHYFFPSLCLTTYW
ncbi:MAG: hypothetical protein WDN75_06435 [Bacteroidota bacterium]